MFYSWIVRSCLCDFRDLSRNEIRVIHRDAFLTLTALTNLWVWPERQKLHSQIAVLTALTLNPHLVLAEIWIWTLWLWFRQTDWAPSVSSNSQGTHRWKMCWRPKTSPNSGKEQILWDPVCYLLSFLNCLIQVHNCIFTEEKILRWS